MTAEYQLWCAGINQRRQKKQIKKLKIQRFKLKKVIRSLEEDVTILKHISYGGE